MFSDALLASVIKQAWEVNSKPAFRLHLLQFIEEGRIVECVHLVRQATGEQLQDDMRIAATRAMVACDDRTGLKKLARNLIAEPHRLSARLAPRLAELLYPNYLNSGVLHTLIECSQQASQFSSDGFASYLLTLHEQAPSRLEKRRLAAGLAELALGSDHQNIPDKTDTRYAELCKGLANLAYAELALCEHGEVENGVLRLLMAVERVLNFYHSDDVLPVLKIRVRKDKRLNRQLMWADAAAWRSRPETDNPVVHVFQIGPFFGRTLWGIDASDLDWLMQDARKMSSEDDRRIAFSAMWYALQGDELTTSYSRLDSLAVGDSVLCGDLAEFMKPSKPDIYLQKKIETEIKEKKKIAGQKQYWLDFSEELNGNPAILSQFDTLTSRKACVRSLYYLTTWIRKHAEKQERQGALSYALLDGVFSPEVIKHYAAGAHEIWRRCKPMRPGDSDNNRNSKIPSHLILDALTLDSQSSGWATGLSATDAKTAICHALMAGSIKCLWVDKIIQARPTIALPEIVKQVRYEFSSSGQRQDILSTAAYHDVPGEKVVIKTIFQLLKRREPVDLQTLNYCTHILSRHVNSFARKDVIVLIQKRLHMHLVACDEERTFAYLRVLASFDAERFARFVFVQLVRQPAESEKEFELRVQNWLGKLFDRHTSSGVALVALQSMSLESLNKLLKLAYFYVWPSSDKSPDSDSTVTRRDLAEGARNALLNEVMSRREAGAFGVLIQMAACPEFATHGMRFLELAHRKAQADADTDPWTIAEVNSFGRLHVGPIKNGEQLLRLTLAVLSDIVTSFDDDDASSRSLLALADDEEKVQQWLAERLKELNNGRYHTSREPKVANSKEPDIVLSSTSCPSQIAIEIKNANKKWTVKQFETAIVKQLAGLYLLPPNRRHGILVISLHKPKNWVVDRKRLNFDQLISHLTRYAEQVTTNRVQAVEVKIIAINAWRP